MAEQIEMKNEKVEAKDSKDVKVKEKKKKDKKPNIFSKLWSKLKSLKSEFKKITWSSKKTTFKNFGLVIAAILVIALVLGLVDFGLIALFNFLAKVF